MLRRGWGIWNDFHSVTPWLLSYAGEKNWGLFKMSYPATVFPVLNKGMSFFNLSRSKKACISQIIAGTKLVHQHICLLDNLANFVHSWLLCVVLLSSWRKLCSQRTLSWDCFVKLRFPGSSRTPHVASSTSSLTPWSFSYADCLFNQLRFSEPDWDFSHSGCERKLPLSMKETNYIALKTDRILSWKSLHEAQELFQKSLSVCTVHRAVHKCSIMYRRDHMWTWSRNAAKSPLGQGSFKTDWGKVENKSKWIYFREIIFDIFMKLWNVLLSTFDLFCVPSWKKLWDSVFIYISHRITTLFFFLIPRWTAEIWQNFWRPLLTASWCFSLCKGMLLIQKQYLAL